jgi:hypothetical protein
MARSLDGGGTWAEVPTPENLRQRLGPTLIANFSGQVRSIGAGGQPGAGEEDERL